MPQPRYLTKSRFKTAYECPRKLYYLDRAEYGNNNKENEFLQALAQGGYQVGALAKVYYPNGIDLEDLNSETAIARTNELLKSENVIIFEAALNAGPYLVRVDVLEKIGNTLRLIEVKAKGFMRGDPFSKAKGKGILSTWEPYLVDVAFQTFVAEKLLSGAVIKPYLLLANKEAIATVDGLHQNFQIKNINGRSHVEIREGTTLANVGDPLLMEIDVKDEVRYLLEESIFPGNLHLPEYAEQLSKFMSSQEKPESIIGGLCKSCEFRIPKDQKTSVKKSGFDECWVEAKKLTPADINKALVFDLWNFRKAPQLIEEGVVFMDQLQESDIVPAKSKSATKENQKEKPAGLSATERQWLQVEKVKNNDPTPYIDHEGLKKLFSGLKYPLHFIDFETSMVAIPFHRGRRPYEQIAFQFSHHTLEHDGTVKHVDEYIHFTPGEFPNFEFVRKLQASLSGDSGTIFRYADHENTVLRQILRQMEALPENESLPDFNELSSFIRYITKPTGSETGEPGTRCMIDLRRVVLECFYHPAMGGSNSIKKVIPAVLAESKFLQAKYPDWVVKDADGKISDPYKLLKPVFNDIPQSAFEGESPLFTDESIDDGGAAMTAWARMQFTEMSDTERKAIIQSLLRYCELDTLSMVWILEYLKNEVS